jgi:hypothetical protein
MKKLFIVALVALIGLAFTAPSFALENEFGGYFRVRMFTDKNFSGNDDGSQDVARADTRTRLYYTAKINDDLKFVSKFEMDAIWGQAGGYGDIGADGVSVEVKNLYADFNVGQVRTRIGTQGTAISRGFIFDDDFSGIVLNSGPMVGRYIAVHEANTGNAGDDETIWNGAYTFALESINLTPAFTWDNMADDDSLWYLSLDLDGSFGEAGSYWGTFIYNGGEIGVADMDVSAFLAGGGFGTAMGSFGIHGQAFYASGDDNPLDNDEDGFQGTAGQCYYWSEIMGYGMFDNQVSNGSPACGITNITALNLGMTGAMSDKWSWGADLWYAQLNEDDAFGYDYLGTELDLSAKYMLTEAIALDFVAAYLFAGDATTQSAANEEDPWEIGTRLSLSF